MANCCDTPIGWKVRPIKDKPGFFRSQPAEWDPMIAESWSTERDGATLVFRIRKGATFPDGRPVTAHAARFVTGCAIVLDGGSSIPVFPKLNLAAGSEP